MIPLEQRAGVEARVDPASGLLKLGEGLVTEESAVRELNAARAAYAQPPSEARPLYYMLNGITPRERPEPDSPLRYELTSLRPGTVGPEWVKTIGHLHGLAPDGLGYPEAYEVVAGEALFVLFRAPAAGGRRAAHPMCVIVEARPGERFVIPPGWHHLAVNPGREAMVFADVVGRSVAPDYSLLLAHRGAPVYLGPNGTRRNPAWTTNAPVARISCAALSETLPATGGRLANTFFASRETFNYLLNPASYIESWAAFEEAVAGAPREPLAESTT